MTRYSFDPASPPRLDGADLEDLRRLREMPDEDIDYSDIPDTAELTGWSRPGPPAAHRPRRAKKELTLRLDEDVVEFFKGCGRGYQSRINRVLRTWMLSNK